MVGPYQQVFSSQVAEVNKYQDFGDGKNSEDTNSMIYLIDFCRIITRRATKDSSFVAFAVTIMARQVP